MKVRKNLEAVFIAAAVLATFATYATADESAVYTAAPIAAATTNMQVVVIKGHRLTAAEKARLG
jgi:Spy/CpxP family protein refolding chaperone